MSNVKITGMSGLALLALLSWSGAAIADDNFGAIAFSQSSGNYGYSIDYSSQAGAERRALDECKDSACSVVVWFKNACGALATGQGNAYGYGWAGSRGEAEGIAMRECNKEASGCSVLVWACTTR